jgi:hypothetical protein
MQMPITDGREHSRLAHATRETGWRSRFQLKAAVLFPPPVRDASMEDRKQA